MKKYTAKTYEPGTRKRKKEYVAWCMMKRRCYCTKDPRFHRYGGRGIKVSDKWLHDFSAFFDDVGPAPSAKHALERIDNDRNYETGNVRWATYEEQARNRSDNHRLSLNGETLTLAEWARKRNLSEGTIRIRLNHGWSHERTLTVAPMKQPPPARREINWRGVTRTIAEWSRLTGIKRSTIEMRLDQYGWSIDEALGTYNPRSARN